MPGYSDDEDVYDNSRVESKPSGEKDDGKQSPSTGPNGTYAFHGRLNQAQYL
jgi:hypothetical protein